MKFYCPNCDKDLWPVEVEISFEELKQSKGLIRCFTCDSYLINTKPMMDRDVLIHYLSPEVAVFTHKKLEGVFVFDREIMKVIQKPGRGYKCKKEGPFYVFEDSKDLRVWRAFFNAYF